MSPRMFSRRAGRARFPRVSGDEPFAPPDTVSLSTFSRVSGDEPPVDASVPNHRLFSPRERG